LHLAVTGTTFAQLYILGPNEADITSVTDTPDAPLNSLAYEALSPGSKGLDKVLARYR
jgi:hypothetical protein